MRAAFNERAQLSPSGEVHCQAGYSMSTSIDGASIWQRLRIDSFNPVFLYLPYIFKSAFLTKRFLQVLKWSVYPVSPSASVIELPTKSVLHSRRCLRLLHASVGYRVSWQDLSIMHDHVCLHHRDILHRTLLNHKQPCVGPLLTHAVLLTTSPAKLLLFS